MGKTIAIAPRGRGRRARRRNPALRRGLGIVLAVVGLALCARLFFIQAYRIPSRSMEDTLLEGDCLLVDKFTYGAPLPFNRWRLPGLAEPQRGDIVVFRYPEEPERVYVKRCLAVAGQTVEIRDKVVYVDGTRLADPPFSKYVDARIFPAAKNARDNFGPRRVPEGMLFVVGDNRDNSRDSRHWGFLPGELVIGRALCVYWSCEPGFQEGLEGLVSLPRRVRWSRLAHFVR